MTDSLSLGKKKDNRSIDFTNIRSGIRKEELLQDVDPKLKSVFEQILKEIDTNPDDNMLSRNELQAFFDKVKGLAAEKDAGHLSKGEAKKFEYTNEKGETKTLGRKGKDALLILLEKLNTLSKDVKITKNNDGSETNEYPDGRTEQVFPDGHKIVTTKSGNKTITSTYDKDDNETKREEVLQDGEGNTITDSYVNKKRVKQVTVKDNTRAEITYNDAEKPESKIVYQANEERHYAYDTKHPNNWRLDQTIQKNNSEDITTDVGYAEDGTKNTETSTYVKPGQQEAYKTVNRTFAGGQVTQEVTTETGKPVVTRTYDSERNYTESYTENGAEITDSYNAAAKKTSQKIVKNGQTYEVNYDENGYTTGIIVQNGETIKSIARKFGVSERDLVAANASLLKGKRYFNVGAEIRIPTPLRADAAVLQGRKDAAGAIAEYRAEQARIAEERRRREEARINKECEELGMTSTAGARNKIKGHFANTPNQETEYTVIGQCKYGTIAKDSKGNVVVIKSNGVIASTSDVKNKTKAAKAQMNAAQSGTAQGDTVVCNGKVYTIVDSTANAKGWIKVKGEDGKVISMSKSFVEASKNLARGQGKFSLTNSRIRYAKDSVGKVWYFDAKGNVICGTQRNNIIKAEAKLISDKLIKATDCWGTDEELLLEGVQQIYCPEILDQINATLQSGGYKNDSLTKPIEDLFLSELSRSESRSYIKALANAGGYGVGAARDKAMGRNCAREIDWELHGGTGYTGSKDLKEALGMADTRAARLETERIVGAKQTQCGKVKATKPDQGSWVRAYIADDDWNAIQVDIFDMVWMKNNAYTHKEDQAHRNGLIERAMTADKTNEGKKDKSLVREARNTVYDAMELGTEDETHARAVAKRENLKRKYKPQHKGQDELQTFIAGTNVGEDGKVDAAEVSANNTNLYKTSKPAEIQAQEILNYVEQGDTSHLFDSMEPEVYGKLNELKGDPNYVRNMYNELMKTAVGYDKMKIKSNAIIAGQIQLSKQELIDFCIELMHSIDDYYGSGASSGQSAKGLNISAYLTTQLKAILSQHPEILQGVKARVEKETFESSSTIYTSSSNYGARSTQTLKENRKGIYLDILNSTYTVDSKSVFFDDQGNEITDSEMIKYIIQVQKDSLKELRKYVAELEREFNKTVYSEGDVLAGTANFLSEYSNIGTDRDDVRTAYRQAKQWLNQLEAAAEGKLRDSSGKNISFQELSQRIMEKVEKLNTDYNTTISYGKMIAVMGPVLLVTLPVSAGASATAGAVGLTGAGANLLVATTAGVAAGGTTYALNYAEMKTSVTGDTMEARERNYLESSVAAFSTAIGAGQMKYICSMFNNASAIVRFGGRLTTVLASDMGVAGVGEYIQSGTVTIEGMTMTLFFSLTGNLIGIKSLTMKDVPNVTPPKPHADATPDVLDVATSHGTRNASDVHVGTKPNKKTGAAPKSQQIHKLVDDYIAEGQMTPKRASEMREQLEQISNPDVREQNIRKLDDAAKNTMSAEDYAAYRQQVETDVRKYADSVLEGTEGINPSDARRVRESFEYRTEKELEEIIAKLEPRKGRYQQGIDQADQLIKEAKAILRRKTAANADISSLTADLDACIAGKRGLNETERAKLKEVLPKLTEDADIQAFLTKWKQIKNPSTSDKSFVRKTLESKGYIKDPNGNFVKKGAGVKDASEPVSAAPRAESDSAPESVPRTETEASRAIIENPIRSNEMQNINLNKEFPQTLTKEQAKVWAEQNNVDIRIKDLPNGDLLISFQNENGMPTRSASYDSKTGKFQHATEQVWTSDSQYVAETEIHADGSKTYWIHTKGGKGQVTPEVYAKYVKEVEAGRRGYLTEDELTRLRRQDTVTPNPESAPKTEDPSSAKPHSDSASQVHDVDSPEALARAKKAADDLFQKVKNLQENGFEGVEILNRLTPEERKIFVKALAYDSVNGTFSIFASGEKPGAIFAGSDEFMSLINKIKGNDFDVVNIRHEGDFSFHSGGNENYINNAIVLNKNMTKSVIAENKEFFARRMDLKDNASVDEIYAKLIAEDGPLKLGGNSDLLGMVLGYPKTSTMIFQLERGISGDVIQLRYHTDLTPYKKELIKVLYSENSPYKNMSPEFKADLESKINSMTEIKHARDVLGGFGEYPFIYFVDEPSEIARIRGNIERTAQKLDDIPSSKPHADGGAPQTKSYAEMNDEELFAEYLSLRNEVEYSPLSNADKAARIKKMNEITRLLEEQGFEVRRENGKPTKVQKGVNQGVKEGANARPSEESKFFSQNDIDNYVADFANIQNDPHAVYAELEKRGFREIGGHTMEYHGDEFINMFNPESGEICTFIYQNGKLLNKNKALATRNSDGTFTRHSDLSIRYDESGKPHVKVDDHSNNVRSARKPEGLSEDYVQKKYGAKVKKAWNEAIGFIKRVASKESYESAKSWIKSKFQQLELLSDLLTRLERQWAKVQFMRKPADSYTGSKVFDRKALDDFVNEPMNKSVMNIFDETHAKGFELLDENGKPYPKDVVIGGMVNPDTYTGKMSFIDPKTGMKYTYGFDNGIMVAKERISPNGETMFYATDGNTGKPHVIIDNGDAFVFYKSFTEIKSRQYQTGAGMNGGDAWTNYHVNNANEIPDAIGIHLEKLPNNEQDAIIDALRNGQDYSITMEGKKFTFQIDKKGNIKVSEFDTSRAQGGANRSAEKATRNREYQQAYEKFNKNQRAVKLEESEFHSDGTLKQDSQYLLDTENLPKLTLIDGTLVDLNQPHIKQAIMDLAEGDFLTLGREGMFEVSPDRRISGQHILITRNNGNIVMKDISRNGQTYASVNTKSKTARGAEIVEQEERLFKRGEADPSETIVSNITPEQVGVGQWRNGYATLTNVIVPDIRSIHATVVYEKTTNSSIITIRGVQEQGFSRPSDVQIRVNGKLSKADALELIKYLEDNMPKVRRQNGLGSVSVLRTMAMDVKQVQELTARFINTKVIYRSPVEIISPPASDGYIFSVPERVPTGEYRSSGFEYAPKDIKTEIPKNGGIMIYSAESPIGLINNGTHIESGNRVLWGALSDNVEVVYRTLQNGKKQTVINIPAKQQSGRDGALSIAIDGTISYNDAVRYANMLAETNGIGMKNGKIKTPDSSRETVSWCKLIEAKTKEFFDNLNNGTHYKSNAATSKFGTPEEPNTMAILSASTESEIREALDIVNNMPDYYAAKNMLRSQLEQKLSEINLSSVKSNASSKPSSESGKFSEEQWNWSVRESNSNGFKRNSNAVTNVGRISADDVYIEGNFTGYGKISGNPIATMQVGTQTRSINTDFRQGLIDASSYSVYNAENNVTVIGIHCNDNFGRSAQFNISVKGQVSEADAKALLDYIESKNLFPKGSNGEYSTSNFKLPQLRHLGDQIREEVANFFNSL